MIKSAGTGIDIRPFTAADQTVAQQLILAGLREHWGYIDDTRNPDVEDIEAHYLQQGHLFVVAQAGVEIVGTGGLVCVQADTMRMVRVSVHKGWRRLGIGRILVEHLVAAARQRGAGQVVVETSRGWHDAISLYQACGFIQYVEDVADVHLMLELEA
jgi:GNAT superfamily N-acetyltransferase